MGYVAAGIAAATCREENTVFAMAKRRPGSAHFIVGIG
jgi:hypothetical protein